MTPHIFQNESDPSGRWLSISIRGKGSIITIYIIYTPSQYNIEQYGKLTYDMQLFRFEMKQKSGKTSTQGIQREPYGKTSTPVFKTSTRITRNNSWN